MDVRILPIKNLQDIDLSKLLIESEADGFRFVRRLVQDYQAGTNCFDDEGEALFGGFETTGQLVAIGGINRGSTDETGRLRRFYVLKDYRRNGIGRQLLETILIHARSHFSAVVLHTDTDSAGKFYLANGFTPIRESGNATHILTFS